MAYLRLVRWPNLLFVALTQALFYFTILKPFLGLYALTPSLDTLHIALLIFSTCLVSAAGYVINDYFDVKADVLNKPNRVFVHNLIPRRNAIKLHFTLNIMATLIGAYLAYKVHSWRLAILNPSVAGVLWFYTTNLKKMPLLGNITIALLTAMVIWIIGLYDRNISHPLSELQLSVAPAIKQIMYGYMFFAFIVTVIREIIKDMEDVEGDKATGGHTLPILLGLRETGYVTVFLILIVIFLLGAIQYYQVLSINRHFFAPLAYSVFFITIPLVYLIIRLVTAIKKSDYTIMSNLVKVILFAGILSMLVLYWQKFN